MLIKSILNIYDSSQTNINALKQQRLHPTVYKYFTKKPCNLETKNLKHVGELHIPVIIHNMNVTVMVG